MEKLDFFTLTDEDGNESDFMFVKEIELDGNTYWICQEAFKDDEKQEMVLEEMVAFKVEKEGEKIFLNSIDDEKEFTKVSELWEKMEKEEFQEDYENEEDFGEDDMDDEYEDDWYIEEDEDGEDEEDEDFENKDEY
ncbi:DUF1292 domain-containing protein [Petrotoga sp. 9PWA.NaAc.5.4]|uniref:DUF1292 domain-containing protein n=1 Tax=Petrotoga sp. 9PWA.NaAc.5.4 TaxID=1434328 RepID=UPI000CB8B5C3|nr:DUF1292 domain-containing protein [Petrotoga sp. 9PWA.NaAc.5.4]PNR96776.1 hypothetical protein X924_02660 [Petrotoga sp. 9PWA.NaAc.5.4]